MLFLIVSVIYFAIALGLFFSIIGTVFPCVRDGIVWFFITLFWPISFIIAFLLPDKNYKPLSNDNSVEFRNENHFLRQ